MVGHGGSSAGSYLADPTFPIPSHCASIVVTSTLRVKFFHHLHKHSSVSCDVCLQVMDFLKFAKFLLRKYITAFPQLVFFPPIVPHCSDTILVPWLSGKHRRSVCIGMQVRVPSRWPLGAAGIGFILLSR